MKTDMRIPPKSKSAVIGGAELAEALRVLVNRSFPLTDKPRTNGSTLRKMIEELFADNHLEMATADDYKVIPYKKKGIPRLLNILSDSYIVTSGDNYNLQVWNRFPNSRNILVRYSNKERIICKDIRLILTKVDTEDKTIKSIVVCTPQYIERKFGKFGVPTMKYQLIISPSSRAAITGSKDKLLYNSDTDVVSTLTSDQVNLSGKSIGDAPEKDNLLSLKSIKDKVATQLIGMKLPAKDTKTRGQMLEREVAKILGYSEEESLVGGYPDIPHQLLEIKVQDSPTVDLGKFSPSNAIMVNEELQVTTEDVRYLIALANPVSGIIEGLVITSGAELGDSFTFVNGTSFKCQRSIPMSFFDEYEGSAVFNP